MPNASANAMPKIIEQMVKPAEKIGGITINKIDGLNGGGAGGATTGGNAGGNGGDLVNQAFDEIRKNALQIPALTAIGKNLGFNMESGLAGIMGTEFDPKETSRLLKEALPSVPGQSAFEGGESVDNDATSGEIAEVNTL